MPRYEIGEYGFEAARPSLAQLTAVRQAGAAGLEHEGMKAFVKRLVTPDVYTHLYDVYGAAFTNLGLSILEEAGVGGKFDLLEEHELEGPLAEAWVTETERSSKIFGEKDPRGGLSPVRVNIHGEDWAFILRMPRGREIDTVRKAKSVEACKTFLTSICVFGNVAALEQDAPGMYLTLAEFALKQAGDGAVKRVGE